MYVIVEAAYFYQSCVIFGSTHNICIAVDDSVHHFFLFHLFCWWLILFLVSSNGDRITKMNRLIAHVIPFKEYVFFSGVYLTPRSLFYL
jgi:hypothetical protein